MTMAPPVERTNRWQIIKHSAWYSAGTMFENVCSLLLGFFVARWLGPTLQGIWQTARLLLSYSDYSTLGLGLGMQREVGVALGRQDRQAAKDYRDTGFCWSVLSMGLVAIGLAGYAWGFAQEPKFRLALLAVSGIVLANGLNSFFNLWYKAISHFGWLTMAMLVRGICLLGTILLIRTFRFEGLLIGQLGASLIVGVLYWAVAQEKPRFRINMQALRNSFRTGFPVLLVGVSGLLFSSLDRIVVISRMGFADMGFYSVSTLVFMPIHVAVSSAAIVCFPRVCLAYGQDDSGRHLGKFLVEPLRVVTTALPMLSMLLMVVMPAAIDYLLPAYRQGLLPAQIAVWGLSFSAATAYCWNIIVGAGRSMTLVLINLASSIFKLILTAFFLSHGLGLNGISVATVASHVLYFTLTLCAAASIIQVPKYSLATTLGQAISLAGVAAAAGFGMRDIRSVWVCTRGPQLFFGITLLLFIVLTVYTMVSVLRRSVRVRSASYTSPNEKV